jgi:ligand-binding sensor domain-containing protein
MKKMIFLLLLFISLTGFINAQTPQWINYTNGDNINALASEGNTMWVGTRGGLVELDKVTGISTFYNKVNSGLPDNDILAISIDENGTKWIGTAHGGLVAFDGTNWIVYNTVNSELPDNNVRSIVIDNDGTRWIGTNGGLAEIDNTIVKSIII